MFGVLKVLVVSADIPRCCLCSSVSGCDYGIFAVFFVFCHGMVRSLVVRRRQLTLLIFFSGADFGEPPCLFGFVVGVAHRCWRPLPTILVDCFPFRRGVAQPRS